MNDLKLLHVLNRTNAVYRRMHHEIVEQDGTLAGQDLYGYGHLLHILIKDGDMTQKELAEKLEIRPQSLTAALEKLEQKGYITRTRDQKDRRIQMVHLTESGKKIGEHLHGLRKKTAETYFSCLNNKEKEQLFELLNKVLENSDAGND